MASKFVLAVFVQVIVAQNVLSQCIGRAPSPAPGPYIPGPYGPGNCGTASSGGGFPVTSVSPIAPIGITIVSENAIEGPLNVGGNLPFLGTVAFESVLPSAGAGAVNYGCGEAVGIVSEAPVATGIVGPAYGAAPVPFGAPSAPLAPFAGFGPGLGGPAPGLLGPAHPGIGCGH